MLSKFAGEELVMFVLLNTSAYPESWYWKLHINSLWRKLGHRLSVFNRILHVR